MKPGGKEKRRAEQAQTSPVVKCDVCGHDFNRSYLKSHKRLSHGKKSEATSETVDEARVVEIIRTLYLQLPRAEKKNVLGQLAAMLEATSE